METLNCRLSELRRGLDGFGEAANSCTYGIRSPDNLAPRPHPPSPKKKLEQLIPFIWDMMLSHSVMGSRIFEAKLCFYLQGYKCSSLLYFDFCRLRHYVVAKHQVLFTKGYSVISQNNGTASHAPLRKPQNTHPATLFVERDPFDRCILWLFFCNI